MNKNYSLNDKSLCKPPPLISLRGRGNGLPPPETAYALRPIPSYSPPSPNFVYV